MTIIDVEDVYGQQDHSLIQLPEVRAPEVVISILDSLFSYYIARLKKYTWVGSKRIVSLPESIQYELLGQARMIRGLLNEMIEKGELINLGSFLESHVQKISLYDQFAADIIVEPFRK